MEERTLKAGAPWPLTLLEAGSGDSPLQGGAEVWEAGPQVPRNSLLSQVRPGLSPVAYGRHQLCHWPMSPNKLSLFSVHFQKGFPELSSKSNRPSDIHSVTELHTQCMVPGSARGAGQCQGRLSLEFSAY